MIVNEIKRLRIGFNSFEPSTISSKYAQKIVRQAALTFVWQECDKKQEWVYLDQNGEYYNFDSPTMYDYRKGLVYEVESGKRLVKGKRLKAEAYIEGLRSTPVVDITHLPGVSLTAQLQVKATEQKNVLRDDYLGYAFDAQTCSMVERDSVLYVTIPIVNSNNLILALFCWVLSPKKLQLMLDEASSQKQEIGLQLIAPICGETLDLF